MLPWGRLALALCTAIGSPAAQSPPPIKLPARASMLIWLQLPIDCHTLLGFLFPGVAITFD